MAVGYGPLSRGNSGGPDAVFCPVPLATMIMADLGADVIKVERPDRPKASGPFLNGGSGSTTCQSSAVRRASP